MTPSTATTSQSHHSSGARCTHVERMARGVAATVMVLGRDAATFGEYEEGLVSRSPLVLALLFLGCHPRRDPSQIVVDARALPSASKASASTELPEAEAPAPYAPLELSPANGTSGCNLAAFGGRDRRTFDAFDVRLRSAATSDDPMAFADLVLYPLQVNRDHRSIRIRTREEFASDAARIFTASVRRAIANQQGFFCRDIGLMYGSGTVWVGVVSAPGDVQPERYGVSTVNVPEVDLTREPSRAAPELKLKCAAPANTVLVEDLGDNLRYRSWRRGQPTTSNPDLSLERGTVTVEGTGPCEHAIYTFKNGDTTYEVSELGCTDGSEPADTTGRLRVSRGGTELGAWLCRGKP